MNMQDFVTRVKSKKELSGISDKIVIALLQKHIPKQAEKLSEKDIKEIVSLVRAELRKMSGRFQASALENTSTIERKEEYSILTKLFEMLKIKSVLDLGCGLNPLKTARSGMKYYAYDINERNLETVNNYFRENKINGVIKVYDLVNDAAEFPDADITLFMKVFDLLEKRGHKIAEKLITGTNSRYILASFSTKTLSSKPMRHPQRGWIERLLERRGFQFIFFSTKNEIFYLASREIIPEEALLLLKQEMR
jgi:SAM-dependent methyltransferase